MGNKAWLKILAISIALVIVTSSVAAYSATKGEKGIKEDGGKDFIQSVRITSANSAECGATDEENQTYEKAIVQQKQAELRVLQEYSQGTPLSVTSFGDIVRTVPAPGLHSSRLALDGVNLWLGLPFEECILKIDPDTGEVLATLSGDEYWRVMQGCTFDGQYLWCNWYDQLIAQIDIGERDTTEVKIGIVQALTGDLGTYGGPMTDAAKLAIKKSE